MHVSESSVDATLGGDGVGSRREQLGDTGCVETGLGKTERGAQTGTAGSDNNRVVLMVDDGVLVADERRRLLCPERCICDDSRSRPR